MHGHTNIKVLRQFNPFHISAAYFSNPYHPIYSQGSQVMDTVHTWMDKWMVILL
jgi:hypothetical protein